MRPSLYLIGGPTASGKTARALALARKENGLVINADAMQVYRDLPLLTAQPTKEERGEIPHELFEIFDPSDRCSAGRWRDLALASVDRAVRAGKTPILVGGTGLYFRALEGGLADIPPVPNDVRQKADALYEKLGHDAFRQKVRQLDPESEEKIKPNDRQRLVRAYAVATHTGKPLGEWHKGESGPARSPLEEKYEVVRLLLLPPRDALYAACDARFMKMVENGALNEVRALLARGLAPDLPSMKILGVRELAEHLRGETSLNEATLKARQATRNYAKRQVTWFKNQWPSSAKA